jgi:hypothetical protein
MEATAASREQIKPTDNQDVVRALVEIVSRVRA